MDLRFAGKLVRGVRCRKTTFPFSSSSRFVGILIPVTLLAAKLVRPDNPSKTKLMPYECGIDPVDSSRGRYTVRYYIVAILFVVFDVETIFLFPWAVQFKALGVFGLIEMLIFLAHPGRGLHLDLEKGRAGVGIAT